MGIKHVVGLGVLALVGYDTVCAPTVARLGLHPG